MKRRQADLADPSRDAGPERSDDAEAFIPDPEDGPVEIDDEVGQALAEDFVRSATTGGATGDQLQDEPVEEELGGPFVITTEQDEMALGPDPSNPVEATREPLPLTRSEGIEAEPGPTENDLEDEDR